MTDPYIFISHSSADNVITSQLARDLREAGFSVWVDLENIEDGTRWLREIQAGVEGCGAMVVVMSRTARSSEWVERETLLALELRKPLFIALIEDVPVSLHLIDRQFTDFRPYEQGFDKLVGVLKATPFAKPAPQKPKQDISPKPDASNFFQYLEQLPEGKTQALVAKDLFRWASKVADEIEFGGKHTPGFHVKVELGGDIVTVFSLWAYMKHPAVQIPFDYLMAYTPYHKRSLRLSTLKSLNLLMPKDERFLDERADRRPSISLLQLNQAETLETFKQIIAEMIENLRSR